MFANMYLAYEALSDGMRSILDQLFAEHDVAQVLHDYDRCAPALAEEFKKISPPVGHPAVRVHPDTQRKSLFVSDRVRRFIGMSDEESAPLLRFLCDFATRPQFVYRHQWRVHDLVMWDNRCTMHLALGDYDRSQRRYMRRSGLRGEPSGYLVNMPAAAD
jgi:taurine dioxygenase